MNLQSKRDTVWFQSLSLGLVGLVVAALLSMTHDAARAAIDAAAQQDTLHSLQQVLPAGYADNDLLQDRIQMTGPDGTPLLVYRARSKGRVKAVLFELSGKAYGGPLSLVMAVDRNHTVLGVRVSRHNETPGLGDRIEAARSDWILAFNGRSLGQPPEARWAVKKDGGDFEQFAGATITPRAVVAVVKKGLLFFAAHKSELLGDEPQPGIQP